MFAEAQRTTHTLEEIAQPLHDITPYRKPAAAAITGHVIQQQILVRLLTTERIVQPNHQSPLFFGRTAPAAPAAGQPFWLWSAKAAIEETREIIQPARHPQRYSVGAAISGQPWHLWKAAAIPHAEVEQIRQVEHSIFAYRRATQAQAGGQPWYLWTPTRSIIVDAEAITQPDHASRLFFGRTAPPTGQPWYLWRNAVVSFDPEQIQQPRNSLFDYRAIVVPAVPGQPWYLWKPFIGEPTAEEVMFRENHDLSLYPFRPHPAITPIPVVEGVYPGSGHPVDWQGKRKKPTLREQPEKHLRSIFDKVVAEYYGEIIESEVPQRVKAEAGNAVRPYVAKESSGARIPKSEKVNWEALELDAKAVGEIIRIWREQISRSEDDDDDDDAILMLLS
jgi:hypothetical protein